MSTREDLPTPPFDFSFSNGAFVGHTLVSRDPEDKPKMGMAKRIDAFAIAGTISMQMGVSMPTGVLPWNHKWPVNKGPKKAAKKKK